MDSTRGTAGICEMKLKRVTVPSSRTELVVETLRASIVSSSLPAGSRLDLDKIASQIGVSRMPVREAVKRLEAEGLVTIYPHRGIEVAKLDANEIEEIFDLRIVLESHAITRAVPRLSQADLDTIETALRKMDRPGLSRAAWMDLNRRFHHAIYVACGSPRLLEFIDKLRLNVERYVRAYLELRGYEHPQQQHHRIFDACRARDAQAAGETLVEHLSDTSRLLLQALQSDDPRSFGNGADRKIVTTGPAP
jgi:DNA-binding GntR family transcriptional regulator